MQVLQRKKLPVSLPPHIHLSMIIIKHPLHHHNLINHLRFYEKPDNNGPSVKKQHLYLMDTCHGNHKNSKHSFCHQQWCICQVIVFFEQQQLNQWGKNLPYHHHSPNQSLTSIADMAEVFTLGIQVSLATVVVNTTPTLAAVLVFIQQFWTNVQVSDGKLMEFVGVWASAHLHCIWRIFKSTKNVDIHMQMEKCVT